jgi:hypothetical protein
MKLPVTVMSKSATKAKDRRWVVHRWAIHNHRRLVDRLRAYLTTVYVYLAAV